MTSVRLARDVVFRSFGSETVLLHLGTGRYHGLTGSGGRMLEVLAETGELQAAADRLAAEFEEPSERILADLRRMCESLAERKLVEIDADR